jgi:hypothetical protein
LPLATHRTQPAAGAGDSGRSIFRVHVNHAAGGRRQFLVDRDRLVDGGTARIQPVDPPRRRRRASGMGVRPGAPGCAFRGNGGLHPYAQRAVPARSSADHNRDCAVHANSQQGRRERAARAGERERSWVQTTIAIVVCMQTRNGGMCVLACRAPLRRKAIPGGSASGRSR